MKKFSLFYTLLVLLLLSGSQVFGQDTLAPVPDAATLPDINAECYIDLVAPTATDDSVGTVIGITYDLMHFTTFGNHTITWRFDDGNGNIAYQNQLIYVYDSIAPVPDSLVLPDITGEAPLYLDTPTGTDNCADTVYVSRFGPQPILIPGTYVITWDFKDLRGNISHQTQNVIVEDNTPPVARVAHLPAVEGSCSVNLTPPIADDNSATTVYATTTDPVYYSIPGTYTVTWTYDDGNGNISTQTQQAIVQPDTIAPVAVANNIVAYLDGTGHASFTAYDANNGSSDNCDLQNITIAPSTFDCSLLFTSYTMTVTDVQGNTATTTATVTLLDTLDPVPTITFLPTITVECGVQVPIATANDNCAGLINGISPNPLSYTTPGIYYLTWQYGDNSYNYTWQPQTVVVTDTTAPVPDTLLQTVHAECSYTVGFTPTATDNSSGTITGVTSDPLTYQAEGTYAVTWSFTDLYGNTSYQTLNIVIDDVTPPVLSATLYDITASCSTTVSIPSAIDNCEGVIAGTTLDPLTYNTQGNYIIYWTFNDGNGNTSVYPQHVIINDELAPVPTVANLPAIVTECATALTATPTAIDNCSGTIIATTVDPLMYTAQGTYHIHWVYDDGNGNITTQTQLVVIADTTGPVPTVATLPAISGACSATVTAAPTAMDNCSSAIIVATTADPVSYTTQGTYTIHWTYSDSHGNITNQDQVVIVDDNIAPVFTVMPVDIQTEVNHAGCTAIVSWSGPLGVDNCTDVTISTTHAPGSAFPLGSTIVTYTLTDGNGNSSQQSFEIIVTNDLATSALTTNESNGNDGFIDLTVTGGTSTYSFAWSNAAVTEDIHGLAAGTYDVMVTDLNGCNVSESYIINTNTNMGVTENTTASASVYPNPSNGQFTLQTVDMFTTGERVQVLDAQGQVVYTTILQADIQSFDISFLSAANYYLQIITETGIVTKKIIVNHR